MSIIATAVKHLLAAGVTGDALVAAIAEMEEQVRAEPKPRSAGAIRQARYEERKRQNASEMTEPDASDAAASLPLPPKDINSNPPAPTHEKQTPRARKGTRLPADWMPKPLTEPLASAVAKWPPGALDRELERLRDWAASATGTNAVKSDWDAAWRNWIRKIEDEGRYGNASNRNSAQPGNLRAFSKPKDGAIAALDRRLGLDGSPGTNRADDAGGSQANRPVALAGPRRLFG